jgi:hypothetical protein
MIRAVKYVSWGYNLAFIDTAVYISEFGVGQLLCLCGQQLKLTVSRFV